MKTCKSCKSNFSGICVDDGELGKYGTAITEDALKVDNRSCWQMGRELFDELVNQLPEDEKQKFFRNNKDIDDLIKRIETGSWK
ncbi:hypothetical protein [Arthrobacter sp. NPDC057013]|uniref:hypothetical protein n=1 Tax=Arthrobacter sp. NPDC057013 TaxID=3345999 RepID=UPI00364037A3